MKTKPLAEDNGILHLWIQHRQMFLRTWAFHCMLKLSLPFNRTSPLKENRRVCDQNQYNCDPPVMLIGSLSFLALATIFMCHCTDTVNPMAIVYGISYIWVVFLSLFRWDHRSFGWSRRKPYTPMWLYRVPWTVYSTVVLHSGTKCWWSQCNKRQTNRCNW